jgi:hypothetical protein
VSTRGGAPVEVEVAISSARREMRRAPRLHIGEEWEWEEAPGLLPMEGKLEVAAGSDRDGGRRPGGVTERDACSGSHCIASRLAPPPPRCPPDPRSGCRAASSAAGADTPSSPSPPPPLPPPRRPCRRCTLPPLPLRAPRGNQRRREDARRVRDAAGSLHVLRAQLLLSLFFN